MESQAPWRVYLAGGLHTNWQGRVAKLLENDARFMLLNPMELQDKHLTLREVAERERVMVDECDAVLCFMEKTNPGGQCAFAEVASAFSHHAAIILVCDDSSNDRVAWLSFFVGKPLYDTLEDGVSALVMERTSVLT